MLEAAASGGREEVGFQRQEQDEENAQEEGGGGLADEGEPHGHMVEDRVALHGRQEPDGHGHDSREEESGQPQLEGGPEIAAHHREGGLSEVERPAEVEPEGIAEEDRVLDGNRAIEAELTAHPVHLADGRVGGRSRGTGSPESRMTTKTTVETSQRAIRARKSRWTMNGKSPRMGKAPSPCPLPEGGAGRDRDGSTPGET